MSTTEGSTIVATELRLTTLISPLCTKSQPKDSGSSSGEREEGEHTPGARQTELEEHCHSPAQTHSGILFRIPLPWQRLSLHVVLYMYTVQAARVKGQDKVPSD